MSILFYAHILLLVMMTLCNSFPIRSMQPKILMNRLFAFHAQNHCEKIIQMHDIVVFSKTYCPYCVKAKNALKEIGLIVEIIELDEVNHGDEIQQALYSMTRQKTVPNVFIKGSHFKLYTTHIFLKPLFI